MCQGPVAGVRLLLRPQSLVGQLSPVAYIQPLKRTVYAAGAGSQVLWSCELGADGTVPVRLTSSDDGEYEERNRHDSGQQKLPTLTVRFNHYLFHQLHNFVVLD